MDILVLNPLALHLLFIAVLCYDCGFAAQRSYATHINFRLFAVLSMASQHSQVTHGVDFVVVSS